MRPDEPMVPEALRRAESGEQAWADAVRLQRLAAPSHVDFYRLAAALVPTLYALEDLAVLLRRQVAGYGEGRNLYDDTRTVAPDDRLAEAAGHLAVLRDALEVAHAHANRFWSAIGHVGIEDRS